MTTKTMDGEEYIKKSDVLALIKSRLFTEETKDGGYVLSLSPTIADEVKMLPTINLSVIDEMIEEVNNPWKEWETIHKKQALQELKQRLSSNK